MANLGEISQNCFFKRLDIEHNKNFLDEKMYVPEPTQCLIGKTKTKYEIRGYYYENVRIH